MASDLDPMDLVWDVLLRGDNYMDVLRAMEQVEKNRSRKQMEDQVGNLTSLEHAQVTIDVLDRWVEIIERALDAERGKARILRAVLESLRVKHHHDCDDGWYSCEKAENYISKNDEESDDWAPECTCGMDRINNIIDKALEETK